LKPNGSTGSATRQSIWESDGKSNPDQTGFKKTIMNKKVYVDNLAEMTTESDLLKLFSPYGNVVEVNIRIGRANHRSRGFGFVTMVTSKGARAAIKALNGKAIGTCTLTASAAWPHEEKEQLCEDPKV
jgi:RNA recognition motif-containing protein